MLELYGAVERHPELISWRHGRCLPYGDGVTFWALGEMVKAQAGILEGDDEAGAERKLREAVSDPWIESHLRPLVGLGASAEAHGDARDEAFTAWRRFFEGLADERPLVLVFEDLHWADDNLLDFVDHLVDWASGVPLLVVSTARPELLTRRPGWGGGKPNALTISLSPLSDDDTARLLHALLGTLLPAETQAELLGRAGGNPLYAEEFARMLRDRGGAGEIPETVQGLIAARLDLLEPDQKALLQDAAVVGKRFWSGALASLDGADASALDVRLHELERKEFVRRERSSGVAGEHEYAFRHLLVRDVAYGQIPRPDRARKHLAAARWIERLGRREDHAEMLAHHYLQALELTRAAGRSADDFADAAHDALTDAGDRAVALHALEPALRFFTAALELVPEDDARRGRLLLRMGRAYHARDETPTDVLERAREALLAAGDVEGAAEAETILCHDAWLAGDQATALAHLEEARRLVELLGASEAKARVIGVASQMTMLAAQNDLAVELGEEALAMAEELGLEAIKASALINVGTARVDLGEHDAGLELLERGTAAAREANVPFDIVRGLGNEASALWSIGRLDRPLALWRQALAESDQYGQTGFSRWFRGVGVGAEIDLGDWDGALARANAFIAEIEGGSPHYLGSECYRGRALVRLARGDERGAVADAERSLQLSRRATDPQARFPGQATAAHVFAELGDPGRAAETVVELSAAVEAGRRLGYAVSTVYMLAWVVTQTGDGPRLGEALERHYDTMWAQAAAAYARGEPVVAADVLDAAGAVAPAAYCRLVAARRGDLDQLEPALAFYGSVRATRYLREGETLLAATTRSA